jgi:hypothetical protein
MIEKETVQFTADIGISVENKEATVIVPPEIRITQGLLNFIVRMVQERGFTLKHMEISPQHEEELKNLPNVVLEQAPSKE